MKDSPATNDVSQLQTETTIPDACGVSFRPTLNIYQLATWMDVCEAIT